MSIRMTRINYLLLFIFLVFLDQIFKYLIRLRGGFYICNEGIAFGIKMPAFIFWIIGVGLIVIIISPFVKGGLGGIHNKNFLIHNSLFLILITAGALSNLIDRLRFGCVIDFIDLKFWPVFNVADIFITVGAGLLLYTVFRK